MSKFATIWKKEMAACFLSPVAYIVLLVFLLLANGVFWIAVLRHSEAGDNVSIVAMLVVSIMLFISILITVITMRLFAEEKRSGTIETLMTAPVSETTLVLGKYAGAMTFLTIVILPALSSYFLLHWLSPGVNEIDYGAFWGGSLFIFLFACYCTAVGMIASMMTRNQVVAAICCFCGTILPLVVPMLLKYVPIFPDETVRYFSIDNQLVDFCRGSLDLRPIVLYVSMTVFVLFAAVQILSFRRYK